MNSARLPVSYPPGVTMPVASRSQALWNALVPDAWCRDPELSRQAKRVIAFDLAMFLWVVVFAIVYEVLGAPRCANAVLFGGVVLAIILVSLRLGQSPAMCANLFCATAWGVYTALALLTGGAARRPRCGLPRSRSCRCFSATPAGRRSGPASASRRSSCWPWPASPGSRLPSS